MVGGAVRVNPFHVPGDGNRAKPWWDRGIGHGQRPPSKIRRGPCYSLVPRMRVAAIDLGKVRVGLAVSDELGMLAHARTALPGGNQKKLLGDLSTLARVESIRRFLVGLPLNQRG